MCRDLRIWVICAGFAFAALITLVIGRKMLREQFEHCRTEKRLEAREIVADEEEMAEYKWKGGAIGIGLPGVMHIFGSASFSFPVMSAFHLHNRLYSVKLTL